MRHNFQPTAEGKGTGARSFPSGELLYRGILIGRYPSVDGWRHSWLYHHFSGWLMDNVTLRSIFFLNKYGKNLGDSYWAILCSTIIFFFIWRQRSLKKTTKHKLLKKNIRGLPASINHQVYTFILGTHAEHCTPRKGSGDVSFSIGQLWWKEWSKWLERDTLGWWIMSFMVVTSSIAGEVYHSTWEKTITLSVIFWKWACVHAAARKMWC